MMDGDLPGSLKLDFGVVDVRDIVDLHIRAMTDPAAKGERFIGAAGDFLTMLEIAKILRLRMGELGKKAPKRELPNWLVHLIALPIREVRQTLPDLGKMKNATSEKARRVLGWKPRSNEECIVATAESLVRLGLLKNSQRTASSDS
jgi:dihydroflavonol-4-reductase